MEFLRLPVEIILAIFRFLSHEDIQQMALVCKQMKQFAFDEQVWREQLFQQLKGHVANNICVGDISSTLGSWRHVFINWISSPHVIMEKQEEIEMSCVSAETSVGNTTITYVPLQFSHEHSFVRVECTFHEELSLSQQKEKILQKMTSMTNNPFPESTDTIFRIQASTCVYYEISPFKTQVNRNDEEPAFFRFGAIAPEAIGIGLVIDERKPARSTAFPGWYSGSVGYHSDDGKLFLAASFGSGTNQNWGVGDIIGCGYDAAEREVFFTKNGKLVSVIPQHQIMLFNSELPMSAMISVDANVRVIINQGQIPFLYSPFSKRDPSKLFLPRRTTRPDPQLQFFNSESESSDDMDDDESYEEAFDNSYPYNQLL